MFEKWFMKTSALTLTYVASLIAWIPFMSFLIYMRSIYGGISPGWFVALCATAGLAFGWIFSAVVYNKIELKKAEIRDYAHYLAIVEATAEVLSAEDIEQLKKNTAKLNVRGNKIEPETHQATDGKQ